MNEIYNKKYFQIRGDFDRKIKRKFFFPKIIKLVNPQRDESILEIGCEKGDLVDALSKYSQRVVGIDINEDAIQDAHKENLFCMSVDKLEFSALSFNKVVSSHTIEHVLDLKKFFTEIERVLKSGGKCILVYPIELIRGLGAVHNAWSLFKNPFMAGRLHLHRLWPNKLKKFTKMKMVRWGILFRPVAIDFYTIFQKE